MSKKEDKADAIITQQVAQLDAADEVAIFEHVVDIIENRKHRAGAYANREVTLMNW
jgi:hypothetical protein